MLLVVSEKRDRRRIASPSAEVAEMVRVSVPVEPTSSFRVSSRVMVIWSLMPSSQELV
jgi:hypothetical protein